MLRDKLIDILRKNKLDHLNSFIPSKLSIPDYASNGQDPIDIILYNFDILCSKKQYNLCYEDNGYLSQFPFYINTAKNIVLLVDLVNKNIVSYNIAGKDNTYMKIKFPYTNRFYLPILDFTLVEDNSNILEAEYPGKIGYNNSKEQIVLIRPDKKFIYNIYQETISVLTGMDCLVYSENDDEYKKLFETMNYLLVQNNLPKLPTSTNKKLQYLVENLSDRPVTTSPVSKFENFTIKNEEEYDGTTVSKFSNFTVKKVDASNEKLQKFTKVVTLPVSKFENFTVKNEEDYDDSSLSKFSNFTVKKFDASEDELPKYIKVDISKQLVNYYEKSINIPKKVSKEKTVTECEDKEKIPTGKKIVSISQKIQEYYDKSKITDDNFEITDDRKKQIIRKLENIYPEMTEKYINKKFKKLIPKLQLLDIDVMHNLKISNRKLKEIADTI